MLPTSVTKATFLAPLTSGEVLSSLSGVVAGSVAGSVLELSVEGSVAGSLVFGSLLWQPANRQATIATVSSSARIFFMFLTSKVCMALRRSAACIRTYRILLFNTDFHKKQPVFSYL